MNKLEFIKNLKKKLGSLPKKEIDDRIDFYIEMIDDRIDEGLSENEAISEIGTVDEICEEIVSEISLTKLAMERIKPKRKLKVWEIVLLALGSPIWISLGVAAIAVLVSLYASFCAVTISIWAVFLSLSVFSFAGVIGGVVLSIFGDGLIGLALIGAALVAGGLAIFFFFVSLAATKGIYILTKKTVLGVKKSFLAKEDEI